MFMTSTRIIKSSEWLCWARWKRLTAAEFKLEAVAFLDDKLADGDVDVGGCAVLEVTAEAPYVEVISMLYLLFMNYRQSQVM